MEKIFLLQELVRVGQEGGLPPLCPPFCMALKCLLGIYICNKRCQVLLWLIYFSPILRQICLWKRRNIIHKICRNSHFRASKIENFHRLQTMVANIFLYQFFIIIHPHISGILQISFTQMFFHFLWQKPCLLFLCVCSKCRAMVLARGDVDMKHLILLMKFLKIWFSSQTFSKKNQLA